MYQLWCLLYAQVCKNYRDGDTCVHACPPPVSLQNYDLALNVNFKYEFGGMCVSECQGRISPVYLARLVSK